MIPRPDKNIFEYMPGDFKNSHQQLKGMLSNEMTNDKLFPGYDRERRVLKVHNELRRLEQIPDIPKLEEFKTRKLSIKGENVVYSEIYTLLEKFYMDGKHDLFFDSLEQMAFRFKKDTTKIQ